MTYGSETQAGNTVAGIFATERDAKAAIKNLHKAGFKKTWVAKTREADRDTGEPTVDNPDAMDRLLGNNKVPLHRALIEHGLTEAQAQNLERDIAFGNTIVTAYGEADLQQAAQCITQANGEVIDATGTVPTAYHRETTARTLPVERGEFGGTDMDDDLVDYESEEFFAVGRR
jgi:hypothetical protein